MLVEIKLLLNPMSMTHAPKMISPLVGTWELLASVCSILLMPFLHQRF